MGQVSHSLLEQYRKEEVGLLPDPLGKLSQDPPSPVSVVHLQHRRGKVLLCVGAAGFWQVSTQLPPEHLEWMAAIVSPEDPNSRMVTTFRGCLPNSRSGGYWKILIYVRLNSRFS